MKTLSYIVPILLLVIFVMYQKGMIMANFKNIDSNQMNDMVKNTELKAIILDVRTPEEYKEGHLKNAILIPHSQIKDNLQNLEKYKGRAILVYCRSGTRSVSASRVLSDAGFDTYNLKGGIGDWISKGFNIEK